MAAAVELRADFERAVYEGSPIRAGDARQTRRRLAWAVIYEGVSLDRTGL